MAGGPDRLHQAAGIFVTWRAGPDGRRDDRVGACHLSRSLEVF